MTNIDDFVNNFETAKRIQDSTKMHVMEAYINAANTHLRTANDELDYTRLDDQVLRDLFKTDIVEAITDKAKDFYSTRLTPVNGKNSMKLDALTEAYCGLNGAAISKLASEHKKDFTLDLFNNITNQAYAPVNQKFIAGASNALTDADIPGLMDLVGIRPLVDTNLMQVNDAVQMYMIGKQYNEQNGAAPTGQALKNYFKQNETPVPKYIL